MLKFMIDKYENESLLIIEYEDKAERLVVKDIMNLIQVIADTILYNFEGKSKYFEQSHYAKVEIVC